jgi:hypothetical protein
MIVKPPNPPQLTVTKRQSRLPPRHGIRYGCGALLSAFHNEAI